MPQQTKTLPHPPRRVPILGDILGMDRERPNQKTLWQFSQLGPIYRRTFVGGTHLTFVGSAELLGQLLDEDTWERYNGRPIVQLRKLGGDGLFTAYNDEPAWTTGHEALIGGFTKPAMSSYHSTMRAVSDELSDVLAGGSTEVSGLETLTNRVALEVIGRCGFGYSFGRLDSDGGAFAEALTRSLAYSQKSSIPVIGALGSGKKQAAKDQATLNQIVDDVIVQRRSSQQRTSDLLDRMLYPEAGGPALTDEQIRNQVITFLVAGHETTGNLLAFACHYIATTQGVADQMRTERQSLIGDRPLQFEDVARLRYTRAVISEALRLWPTAPGFFRAARKDTQLGDFSFKAGEWVFLLLLAVHRDKNAWGPDAENFRPDRFLTRSTVKPNMYRPFGTGPRACIGRQFALHEATVILSDLVNNYDLHSADTELTVEENLTLRPTNVRMNFTKR